MSEDYSDIIHRMMRDLAEDDSTPNGAPRCDGCGRRVELAPYLLRASNGSQETVMYCAECRALAMVELVEDDGE
jgi:hypothetical protein